MGFTNSNKTSIAKKIVFTMTFACAIGTSITGILLINDILKVKDAVNSLNTIGAHLVKIIEID